MASEMSDREIDALVAEKVMGLVRCTASCHDPSRKGYQPGICHAQPDSPDRGSETSCYSTDIAAAMEVVEKMRAQCFRLALRWIDSKLESLYNLFSQGVNLSRLGFALDRSAQSLQRLCGPFCILTQRVASEKGGE